MCCPSITAFIRSSISVFFSLKIAGSFTKEKGERIKNNYIFKRGALISIFHHFQNSDIFLTMVVKILSKFRKAFEFNFLIIQVFRLSCQYQWTEHPESQLCISVINLRFLDSVLKKCQGETQEFCPSAKVVGVGYKLGLCTDLAILRELSKERLIPVSQEQGTVQASRSGLYPMWNTPPGPLSSASGMSSLRPQWPPLTVIIGRWRLTFFKKCVCLSHYTCFSQPEFCL